MHDGEKAEKKKEKACKDKEKYDILAPVCRKDVQKGLVFVLDLNNNRRKQMLKIHFRHALGLSGKKVAEMAEMLWSHMSVLNIPIVASIAGDVFCMCRLN